MAKRVQSASPKKSQGETKTTERGWQASTVIAAVIAALAAIGVALINQHSVSKPKSSDTPQIQQQTQGLDSPTIAGVQGSVTVTKDVAVTASGSGTAVLQTGPGSVHITNISGISKEEHERLREELGVTDSALKSFFKILEQQQVPREDLDNTLRNIAKRYKELQDKLQTFTSDDPAVIALKREASKALDAGDFTQAEKLLNEASQKDLQGAQQFQEMATKRWLSAAASKAELGALKETQLRWAEATSYYRQAAELVELVPKSAEVTLATYLHYWGFASYEAGDYRHAEPPLTRALAIQEKMLGPEHPDIVLSLITLARLYQDQSRYAETESLLQRAIAIQKKVLGPEHPYVAANLNNLAVLYYMRGQYAQAEPLFQQTIALLEKVAGSEHWVLARSLNALAALYFTRREYHQAEPLLWRALAIQQKSLGSEDPDLTITLNNLARIYQEQGHHAEAEPLLQWVLAINEKVLGPEHPTVAIILSNLAISYHARRQYDQAESLFMRALSIRESVSGPEHPDTAITLNNLARVYQDQGRYAEAEPLYLRAVAIREKMPGPEHLDLSVTLNNLATLYNVQHQYSKAEPLYQRALAILEKVLGSEHPDMILVLDNYSALLRQTDRVAEADEFEIRARKIRAKHESIDPVAP
jgi:tetratricopeptide (TPR) repeat protein